jgi:hypothetical protein
MKLLQGAIVVGMTLGFAVPAAATPITWTLNDVTLTGALGTVAVSGSFISSSPTTITSWDITLSGAVSEEFKTSNSDVFDVSSSDFYFYQGFSAVFPDPVINFDLAAPLNSTSAIGLLGNGTATYTSSFWWPFFWTYIPGNTYVCQQGQDQGDRDDQQQEEACSELRGTGGSIVDAPAGPSPVPEPATLSLLGLGLTVLASQLRARRKENTQTEQA